MTRSELRNVFRVVERLHQGKTTQLSIAKTADQFHVLRDLVAMGLVEDTHQVPGPHRSTRRGRYRLSRAS